MLNSALGSVIVPAVLWLLIALSVITWALFAIKLLQYVRVQWRDARFSKKFWSVADLSQGEFLAARSRAPMARIAQAGFAVVNGQDTVSNTPVLSNQIDRSDRLERALQREIERQRRTLESWIVILASLGSTAPFVGLFGTVWGVMEALVSIGETGSTGLQTIAGPVGHALIATGLGIAVAVPAVLIYNFLVRRLKAHTHALKNFAHDFYNLCQQCGFQAQSSASSDSTDPIPLAANHSTGRNINSKRSRATSS